MTETASHSLATLIDETVLKRRITVAFGTNDDTKATLLVAGRRLLRIDEVIGVAQSADMVGNQLAHNDEAQKTCVRSTLDACLKAGSPRITAIEKAMAYDDPTARGLSAADIFAAA
ncbi:MAG: hypothetical protein HKN27_14870 [Silicimonas sp.]|nr:hypothetical protein [Silicimonas sp.]